MHIEVIPHGKNYKYFAPPHENVRENDIFLDMAARLARPHILPLLTSWTAHVSPAPQAPRIPAANAARSA